MSSFTTLTELLNANRRDDRFIQLICSADERIEFSFADLADRAERVCAQLQEGGLSEGQELLIYTRSNLVFLESFWAAVIGGFVPVPVAVGASVEHQRKLKRILSQLKNAALLTDTDLRESLIANQIINAEQATFVTSELESPAGNYVPASQQSAESLAFVQYSSGSTGDPKGVLLTHDNVVVNCRSIATFMGWDDTGVGLSWMPLTHDMGLIVMHLSLLAQGMTHGIIDTDLFVRRPLLWLEQASAMKATVLCSPNFGYRHCMKLIARKGLPEVDLSSVKTVFNGAEPISWQQCDEFLEALAPVGLARTAMLPVYGLAEATVGVSIPNLGQVYKRITLNRHHLNTGAYCELIDDGHPDAISFVKVGYTIDGVNLRIVGEDDRELARGHIGHIQLQGRSVTSGFYDHSEKQRGTFTEDGWLRTGDCGVIHEGELVISGREKDIVIVNGQNYYAHDLESFVNELEGLELGKVIVAATRRPTDNTEKILIFILHRKDDDSFAALANSASERIAQATGVQTDYVIPVRRIPKTTSGKVQRNLLATNFANGEYDQRLVSIGVDDVTDKTDASTADLLLHLCAQHSGSIAVSIDDDLFEVGISSLMLTEFVLAIDEKFPGTVDIDDVFDYPSIRALAERIDELTGNTAST